MAAPAPAAAAQTGGSMPGPGQQTGTGPWGNASRSRPPMRAHLRRGSRQGAADSGAGGCRGWLYSTCLTRRAAPSRLASRDGRTRRKRRTQRAGGAPRVRGGARRQGGAPAGPHAARDGGGGRRREGRGAPAGPPVGLGAGRGRGEGRGDVER